jgi:hypothetical protein
MSHIASIDITITDLAALQAAARELGALWVEGKKTYNWFGQSVGDYPLPTGMTVEQLGKCDHVIALPGVRYEIGVVKRADGNFTLAYDFYGRGRNGSPHDGEKLLAHFGEGLAKIKQFYGLHKATIAARLRGYSTSRKLAANGDIKLQITGI